MFEQYMNIFSDCPQLLGYFDDPIQPDENMKNIKESACKRIMSHAELYIIWVKGMHNLALENFEKGKDFVKGAQMFSGSVSDIEELFKLSEDIIQNESLEKFF
ncbi:MAG: hypothetical protein GY749_08550 [Desulfobacteraceae bacterium]|nr:hypothetical protein [Desulfobacteraceae bacterium]